jgi:hypothetical protein
MMHFFMVLFTMAVPHLWVWFYGVVDVDIAVEICGATNHSGHQVSFLAIVLRTFSILY